MSKAPEAEGTPEPEAKLVKMRKGEIVLDVHPSTVESHRAAGFTEYVAEGVTGELPETFPGYDKLKAAGITTYEGVAQVENLTTIEGIGQATADKIEEAYSAAIDEKEKENVSE